MKINIRDSQCILLRDDQSSWGTFAKCGIFQSSCGTFAKYIYYCCLAYFLYVHSVNAIILRIWIKEWIKHGLYADYRCIRDPTLTRPFRVATISIFKISKTHWLWKTRIMLSSIFCICAFSQCDYLTNLNQGMD